MSDPICPTFAAGTIALATGSPVNGFNNDSVAPGGANGYVNQYPSLTVGSFNNSWTNGDLNQNVQPTYRNGLLSFGNTGLQS